MLIFGNYTEISETNSMILSTVGWGVIENRIDKLVHSPLRILCLNLSLATNFVSVLLQTDGARDMDFGSLNIMPLFFQGVESLKPCL